MRLAWILLLSAVALAALMPLVSSSPIDPAPFDAPTGLALEGALEQDERLESAELLGIGELRGPEDVDFDPMGRLVTGNADGEILRRSMESAGGRFTVFADTGGRPLGLDFAADGRLWVADSEKGLVSIDPVGLVEYHSRDSGPSQVNFANDVVTGPDGTVYLSDASTRWGPSRLALEALEARAHGRLLEFMPATEQTRVLLRDLYFANGVAVSADGSFVLVAESFRYRIRRYWLSGPRTGEDEVLVEHLPGYPDGISLTPRGTFWVAIYDLRSKLLDRRLHPRPWLKRLVARLPKDLLTDRPSYGLIVELDADGRLLRSLHDSSGKTVRGVTSVVEQRGALYLAMLKRNAIGRLSWSGSG